MNRRAAAGVIAVMVVAAACTSDDNGEAEPPVAEPPVAEPTDDGTTTPEPIDPTAGVDDALIDFYTQELAWEACDDFECATIDVPLDYAAPDQASIEIAVLRVLAASDDRVGSLVINPGGPGGSGVESAMSPDVATNAVTSRYDIIGFDPRGVGASTPIECLADDDLDRLLSAEAAPRDAEQIDELVDRYAELVAGCELRSGDLLAHVGSENVARDLDILRAALGEESLHYLGRSYGSYLGALYAEEFPARVGRMVLDGAVDPSLTGREFALGQAAGVDRALRAYLTWCVERDDCPLGPTETQAYGTLTALFEVLADDPLPTADESRPLTEALALFGVVLPLYVSPEEGYEVLTAALAEALAGNGEILSDLADIYLDRDPSGTFNSNQNEVLFAVHCLDRPDLTDPDEIEASMDEFIEASPLLGPYLAWGGLACAQWPHPPAVDPAPVSAAGAGPIVVVGTTGDHATPYEWAEALADQLESGVLVTFDGFGHLAYNRAGNDCIDDIVDTYLLDGEVPEGDVLCS